ncbi:MAG: Histidine kinase [Mesotoga prima]|uniref:histidine kinase n=1 Tax=Mesotoga prima TaxID=1184387 RepID=A0A117M3D1_9BACT|nr:MAG: Histidine kinase [Mesotoga prima]
MRSVTGEELAFKKAKRRWTLFFTLVVVTLVSVLSLLIFVLALRLEGRAEIIELNRIADRIESRIGRPPAVGVERMIRNYPGNLDIFTSEDEILEFVTPSGEILLQLGGAIISDIPIAEGTSRVKAIDYGESEHEYTVLTREIRGIAGQPVFFLRVGKSTEGLSDGLKSLLFSLLLLVLMVAVISWVAGMTLARYVLTPLKESYERLQRFTADASHELKTPLTILRLGVDMLKERKLEKESMEKIDMIDGATRSMQNVVNKLLLLARVQNEKKLEIAPEDVELGVFLAELKEYHRPLAESRGVRILVESRDDVVLKTSSDDLKVAVAAILENAIKFTEENSDVTINAFESEGFALIQISDLGSGVADSEKERVFERFYKTDESHNSPGSGLGLSIAREIIGSLGGEITVRNHVDGGSTFEIRIPLRKHK